MTNILNADYLPVCAANKLPVQAVDYASLNKADARDVRTEPNLNFLSSEQNQILNETDFPIPRVFYQRITPQTQDLIECIEKYRGGVESNDWEHLIWVLKSIEMKGLSGLPKYEKDWVATFCKVAPSFHYSNLEYILLILSILFESKKGQGKNLFAQLSNRDSKNVSSTLKKIFKYE